jgi:hypothetical protein
MKPKPKLGLLKPITSIGNLKSIKSIGSLKSIKSIGSLKPVNKGSSNLFRNFKSVTDTLFSEKKKKSKTRRLKK